jgi:hypothetical protein
MKSLLRLLALALCVFGLSSVPGSASEIPKLSHFFDQKVSQVQSAMRGSSDPTLGEALRNAHVVDFNLDFTAQINFGLSEVLRLSVSPEIDFVFVPDEAPAPEKN